jgi:hypothetical protein
VSPRISNLTFVSTTDVSSVEGKRICANLYNYIAGKEKKSNVKAMLVGMTISGHVGSPSPQDGSCPGAEDSWLHSLLSFCRAIGAEIAGSVRR